MRTSIFDPNNFVVNLRTNNDLSKIILQILDRRLPADTVVEPEEIASYGLTPMYYADDCCIVSAAYLAQIVRHTLKLEHGQYEYDCHVYTTYSILPNEEVRDYQRRHKVYLHSGAHLTKWPHSNAGLLADIYHTAKHAIACLMRDQQAQTFNPDAFCPGYDVPLCLATDNSRAIATHRNSIDNAWMRLRQMSNPDDVAGMRDLNKMVGMEACKTYIHQLICDVQLRRMRDLMGLRSETRAPMHFVFMGNPGTGKTTVAKALGKALHEAGIISRGDVVYRDRSTLVGAHVGESENLVKELFENEAPGNIVVIDEAYALTADSWQGDFGHRVVDSLMTYTANPDADYVVVLCGYRDDMERMLASNAGLSSRFSLRFDFPDFSHDELMEITRRSLANMDYHFTPDAEDAYSGLLREVLNSHQPHFGNARWVDSAIHQHILEAQHSRLTRCLTRGVVRITRDLFTTIEQADVLAVADSLRHLNTDTSSCIPTHRRIGFAA